MLDSLEAAQNLHRISRKRKRRVLVSSRYLTASYLLVLVMFSIYFYFAFFVSSLAVARSGSGLIFVSTVIAGLHLLNMDRARSYFAENFRQVSYTTGPPVSDSRTEEENQIEALQIEAFGFNRESEKAENRIIRLVILWETALVALGTLVWGYGDLFFCFLNGDRWPSC